MHSRSIYYLLGYHSQNKTTPHWQYTRSTTLFLIDKEIFTTALFYIRALLTDILDVQKSFADRIVFSNEEKAEFPGPLNYDVVKNSLPTVPMQKGINASDLDCSADEWTAHSRVGPFKNFFLFSCNAIISFSIKIVEMQYISFKCSHAYADRSKFFLNRSIISKSLINLISRDKSHVYWPKLYAIFLGSFEPNPQCNGEVFYEKWESSITSYAYVGRLFYTLQSDIKVFWSFKLLDLFQFSVTCSVKKWQREQLLLEWDRFHLYEKHLHIF